MSAARRLAALVATGTVVAAGCGGGAGGDASPRVVITDREALLSAATATLDAGTARMTLEVGFEGGAGEIALLGDFALRGEGVVDLGSGEGTFTFDMGSVLGAVPPDERDGLEPDDLVFEVRVVDGVVYMRGELFTAQLGVPTAWVSLDLDAALDQLGVDAGTFAQLQQQANATDYVEWLAAASDDATEVGTEDVRGTRTTRYHATLDFARMLEAGFEQLPDELRARLESHGDLRDALGPLVDAFAGVPIEADVWVDDADRLRRLAMRVPMDQLARELGGDAAAGGLGDAAMTLTIELYDYGVALAVEAPPADAVTDLLSYAG